MEYNFKLTLLDREIVNEFIRCLHRPEPSGYGALPPKSMRVAYGVSENSTGIILTLAYEDESSEWKGKEGDHNIQFDVMSKEGCFAACFNTNAYGDNWENAKICGVSDCSKFYKYENVVRKGICFYFNKGNQYEEFANEFEKKYAEPLYKYSDRIYKEIFDEWSKKWI